MTGSVLTLTLTAADLAALNSGNTIILQGPSANTPNSNTTPPIANTPNSNTSPPVANTTPPVVNPLSITGFAPTTGGIGTQFTINGTGFTQANAVKIGGLQFAPTKIVSDSQIVATVPSGAVTGGIAVGSNTTWAFDNSQFTVSGTPAPVPVPTPNTAPAPVSNTSNSTLVASTSIPARTITPLTPPATGMKFIKVSGNTFVDQNGTEIVPNGVNVSGLENTAIQNWDGSQYWGDSGFPGLPPVALLQEWGVNIVRIPYNTASWLGLVCVDGEGVKLMPADPAGIYPTVLDQAVMAYTAAGFYIIIEQHWSAPFLKTIPNYPNGAYLAPQGQGAFSDASTSPVAFAEIATRYSKFTNVILGCFNEPFLDSFGPVVPSDVGVVQKLGGTCGRFSNNSDAGADFTITETWEVCGFQTMITAARNAGFTGPISVSDRSYAQDHSAWLTNVPTDPLKNIFADWHAYPTFGTTWGTPAYTLANYGANNSVSPTTGIKGTCYEWVLGIKAAGYPVMITEYGDHNAANTVGAPFASAITTFAKANKIGTIAWAFCVTGEPDNNLLKDTNATPCDGYGVFVKQFLTTGNTANPTHN